MKLTAKARTAVTALADLAVSDEGEPVALSAIGVRQGLSITFLEQIFGKLRRAGLVESRRGVGGGYVLARPASDIAIADIVRAIDEEIRSTACRPGAVTGCRGTTTRCLTHGLWADLDGVIHSYLSGVTLADVVSNAPQKGAAHA
jgi:Rrf2 family iron-sulfur cluster assembly transcriptional regulator